MIMITIVCQIIAQDGPVSFNTGILITRVSAQGEEVLHNWVYETSINNKKFWVFDQGESNYIYIMII